LKYIKGYYPKFGTPEDTLFEFLDENVLEILDGIESISDLSRFVSYAGNRFDIAEFESPGISAKRNTIDDVKYLLNNPTLIGAKRISHGPIAKRDPSGNEEITGYWFDFYFDEKIDFLIIKKHLENYGFENIEHWDTSIGIFNTDTRI
jgi:hypothetical protein